MTMRPTDWTDRDTVAEYLAYIALQLATRVRDDDPVAVRRWLHAQAIPAREWPAFAVVLAAHIDVDRTQADLIGWALPNDDPAPWRPAKAEYVRLRAAGVNTADIPVEIRRGESRYNMALRKQRATAVAS